MVKYLVGWRNPATSTTYTIDAWAGDYLGANLASVDVTIRNSAAATVATGTTDANGEIAGMTVQSSGNPHTVEFAKSGKQTITVSRTFTSDETIRHRLMTNASNVSSLPSTLSSVDTQYTLTGNLTAAATGLTCSASGINIDLAGYTLTYENAGGGVANYNFEAGSGTTATGWSVGATGAERQASSVQIMLGDWHMNIPESASDQTITSDWFDLPASTACRALFVIKNADELNLVEIQVEVEHSVDGMVAGKRARHDPDYLDFTTPATAGQFRYLVTRVGKAALTPWAASTSYSIGDKVTSDPTDTYARVVVQAGGVSTANTGGSEPTWPTTLGGTVVDGSVTWECVAYGTTESGTAWTATTAMTVKSGAYYLNATKYRPTVANGYLYRVKALSVSGTSGGTQPSWQPANSTNDNDLVWSYRLFHDEDLQVDECNVCPLNKYGIVSLSADRISVFNGTVTQANSGFGCYGIYGNGATDWIIDDVTVATEGMESPSIYLLFSDNSEVTHCTVTNAGTYNFNRSQLKAAVHVSGAVSHVHHNTVSADGLCCILAGYSALIERNTVSTTGTVTNHYAIIGSGGNNSTSADATRATTVTRNTVTCGPGQGISLRGSTGGGGSGNICTYNTITINSAAPNLEYDEISFDAIRLNDYGNLPYNIDNQVSYNTITLNCQLPSGISAAFQQICGITSKSRGAGNVFNSNTITVNNVANAGVTSCCAFNIGYSPTDTDGPTLANNTITTDEFAFFWGGYPDSCNYAAITNTSINQGGNPKANFAIIGNDYQGSQTFDNITFRNTTIDAGTLFDIGSNPLDGNYAIQNLDWIVSGDLQLTVTDTLGAPISGASVTITDALTNVVYSGTTDGSGRIPLQTLIVKTIQRASSTTTPTDYNNYAIDVSKTGYTSVTGQSHTQPTYATTLTIQLTAS